MSRSSNQKSRKRPGRREACGCAEDDWSVWLDPDIPPGEIWDELIEQELANVRCVVVLWSATSIR
jgi:hypothetical protein